MKEAHVQAPVEEGRSKRHKERGKEGIPEVGNSCGLVGAAAGARGGGRGGPIAVVAAAGLMVMHRQWCRRHGVQEEWDVHEVTRPIR